MILKSFKEIINTRTIVILMRVCAFSILSFLIYCCNDSFPLENNGSYPTVISAKSNSEIKQLQNEFDAKNDYKIGAKLNKYGFIGNDTAVACPFNSDVRLSSTEIFIIVANNLLANKKFTNTEDALAILSSSIGIKDLHNGVWWSVKLGPQKYRGMEILNSSIIANVYGDKMYCISNSWYPNPFIPTEDKINPSIAKTKVIGYKLKHYPNAIFTISERSIGEITNKIVVPLERDNTIELRVAWRLPIKVQESTGWYVYVDTTTGEIVGTTSLIDFG